MISYVSAAQLPAFVRDQDQRDAHPFIVTPPGHRAFYCFATMGVERPGVAETPRGYDLCDGPEGALIASARNSGSSDVIALLGQGAVKLIAFETPMYRGGVTPATRAARQRNVRRGRSRLPSNRRSS